MSAADKWSWAHIQAIASGIGPDVIPTVWCHANAPLIALALRLKAQFVPCRLLNRQLALRLLTLSKQIMSRDGMDEIECRNLIQQWGEHEILKRRASRDEPGVWQAADEGESLMAIATAPDHRNADDIRAVLADLGSDHIGRVMLASGDCEQTICADIVVHLDPWRIPSRYALQMLAGGDPRQISAELEQRDKVERVAKHKFIRANLADLV